MSLTFARSVLKVAVAQTCQNIGWHAVQSSPLEMLVDIMHRYMLEITTSTHMYSNQYGRTEPNLLDLSLAFQDMGIQLQELEEYVNNVEPNPFAHKVAPFPISHSSNLQHPKVGSRDVAQRPEWIEEHLPPIHPELEEEDPALSVLDGSDKKLDQSEVIHSSSSSEELSPASSPQLGLSMKRSADAALSETTNAKRPRLNIEEEGRPMREVASVFMTPSGFISPSREGKLPEAKTPQKLIDSRPNSPDYHSSSSSSASIRLPTSVPMKKDIKSTKLFKKMLGSSKKGLGSKKDIKLKLSKKTKGNKENTGNSPKSSKAFMVVKKSSKSGMDQGSKAKKRDKSSKLGLDSGKFIKMKTGSNKIKIAKVSKPKNKDILKLSKQKHKSSKHLDGKSFFSPLFNLPKSPKKLKSPARSKSQSKSPKAPKKTSGPSPLVSFPQLPPATSPVITVPLIPKVPEVRELSLPVKIEALGEKPQPVMVDMDDTSSRDESPEPRLVIDDEAQARQEKESRMAVLDECINAVIERAKEESEREILQLRKDVDETINEVVHSSAHVSKKVEPRDIYDFTDSSDSSPPTPKTPEPMGSPGKKEKVKILELLNKTTEGPKRKKSKSKKKPSKKSPSSSISPKQVKEEKKPVPQIKTEEDSNSSDEVQALPSPGFSANPFQPPRLVGTPPPSSLFTSMAQQKFPSMGFSASPSPFTPVRTLTSNPFPTPPLFVSPSRTENSSAQQMQPLNLAIPPIKSPPRGGNKKQSPMVSPLSLVKTEDLGNIEEKVKSKKVEKKGRKPKKEKGNKTGKTKDGGFVPKEKPKAKEKVKVERKGKGDKKIDKSQIKDDSSSIPKITFKLGSSVNSSAKIVIKSSTKVPEEVRPATPPPPSPPPPEPPAPSPPPPAPLSPPPPITPITPLPPVTGTGRGRQGGRGRGGAAAAAKKMAPPSSTCTVITETLGTITDESGNKIWICPACTRPDDGSPMIGCDECDDWYHWVCVSIVVPPKEEESWFCSRCISKRQSPSGSKKFKKKHKRDK